MDIQDLASKSAEASRLLSVLSNQQRLRILCELQSGERSVTSLEAAIGLSQSALSQHLAKLRAAGVVATRREAQTIYYSVSNEKATRVLALLYDMFCKPTAAAATPRRRARQ